MLHASPINLFFQEGYIYLAVIHINKQLQKLHSTTLNMVIKYPVGVQSVTAR
jgi:hypothetical protein